MSQRRYPHELPVTVEHFLNCGWQTALQRIDENDFGYPAMWTAFSKAATEAAERGCMESAKVLWLLADACSMMLRPGSLTEPFKPFAAFHDRRSALPEDFSIEDLSLFAGSVQLIDNALLKARVADLLWQVANPRQIHHAFLSIDAYQSFPLEPRTWVRGAREGWERGLVLAQSVGRGGGERVGKLRQKLVDALLASTVESGFFGVSLAQILRDHHLAKEGGFDIAEKLAQIAQAFDGASDIMRARAFYEESANWFHWLGQQEKYTEMTVAQAETYAREATFQSANLQQSPSIVGNSLYEKAIQIYRDTPKRFRQIYRVDERIKELRHHQNHTAEKTLDEMGLVRGPGIDITEFVDQARNAISGKEPIEALRVLANIQPEPRFDALRERMVERVRQFPLQWMVENTIFSRDGRVIAKRPAINILAKELSETDEKAIWAAMVRDHGMFLGIALQSSILPALEVLRLEHRLREADFVDLARHSPIVPNGRAGLFGRALFAGYDGDFAVALHLLTPQIEHMVRTHLKQADVATTTLDKDGIENENGLSKLMALPEVTKVFGEDLVFELRALFCDAFGPNLRNECAHGLLDDSDCSSAAPAYAWWLGLRLVFKTWWNAYAAVRESEMQVDGSNKVKP